jgi:hypothetical protein
MDRQRTVRDEVTIAFDPQAEVAGAQDAQLTDGDEAKIGRAEAENADSEGAIVMIRIKLAQEPDGGALRREEFEDGHGIEFIGVSGSPAVGDQPMKLPEGVEDRTLRITDPPRRCAPSAL